ncbi:hypothetical protein BpHYR1_004572, partial [Brachionus plicatilis]
MHYQIIEKWQFCIFSGPSIITSCKYGTELKKDLLNGKARKSSKSWLNQVLVLQLSIEVVVDLQFSAFEVPFISLIKYFDEYFQGCFYWWRPKSKHLNLNSKILASYFLKVLNYNSTNFQPTALKLIVLGGGQLWPAGLRPDLNGHLAG